jgi:hypothetical protein
MAFPELPPLAHSEGSNFIYYRIGPIFDSAYLKNIDPGIMKEITLISARAELSAAQAHVQALQAVVQLVEKAAIENRRA